MTARMTHTRSGSPTGPSSPAAAVRTRPRSAPSVRPEVTPGVAPAPTPPPGSEPVSDGAIGPAREPVSVPPTDRRAAPSRPRPGDRRAQRAARRRRRRLAVWCAVLVAFCLGVTILIVVMAGNRTPGPQVVAARTPVAAPPRPQTGPAHPLGAVGVADGPGRGRG
jgi:hypothetical protein